MCTLGPCEATQDAAAWRGCLIATGPGQPAGAHPACWRGCLAAAACLVCLLETCAGHCTRGTYPPLWGRRPLMPCRSQGLQQTHQAPKLLPQQRHPRGRCTRHLDYVWTVPAEQLVGGRGRQLQLQSLLLLCCMTLPALGPIQMLQGLPEPTLASASCRRRAASRQASCRRASSCWPPCRRPSSSGASSACSAGPLTGAAQWSPSRCCPSPRLEPCIPSPHLTQLPSFAQFCL